METGRTYPIMEISLRLAEFLGTLRGMLFCLVYEVLWYSSWYWYLGPLYLELKHERVRGAQSMAVV